MVDQSIQFGTFFGVGVGIGVFLLIVLVILVGLIIVAVVFMRKAANNKEGENLYYNNTIATKKEMENKEDVNFGDGGSGDEKDFVRGDFDPNKDSDHDSDSEGQIKYTEKLAPELSTTPVSAANIEDLYAIADKSKNKGTKKEREGGAAAADRGDLYSMPMKKKVMMRDEGDGVVESISVEKEEEYDDTVDVMYEPMAVTVSETEQKSEGDGGALTVDTLYTFVD